MPFFWFAGWSAHQGSADIPRGRSGASLHVWAPRDHSPARAEDVPEPSRLPGPSQRVLPPTATLVCLLSGRGAGPRPERVSCPGASPTWTCVTHGGTVPPGTRHSPGMGAWVTGPAHAGHACVSLVTTALTSLGCADSIQSEGQVRADPGVQPRVGRGRPLAAQLRVGIRPPDGRSGSLVPTAELGPGAA